MAATLLSFGGEGPEHNTLADSPFDADTTNVEGSWSPRAVSRPHSAAEFRTLHQRDGDGEIVQIAPQTMIVHVFNGKWSATPSQPVIFKGLTVGAAFDPGSGSPPYYCQRATDGDLEFVKQDLSTVLASVTDPWTNGSYYCMLVYDVLDTSAKTLRRRAYFHAGTPDTFTSWGSAILDHTSGTMTSVSGNITGMTLLAITGAAASVTQAFDSWAVYSVTDDADISTIKPPAVGFASTDGLGTDQDFSGAGTGTNPDNADVDDRASGEPDGDTTYDGTANPGVTTAKNQTYTVSGFSKPAGFDIIDVQSFAQLSTYAGVSATDQNVLRRYLDSVASNAPNTVQGDTTAYIYGKWRWASALTESQINGAEIGLRHTQTSTIGTHGVKLSAVWMAILMTKSAATRRQGVSLMGLSPVVA